MVSAAQYLRDGKPADARRALAPVAYDPHGDQSSRLAKSMIAKIIANDSAGAIAMVDGKPDEKAEGRD